MKIFTYNQYLRPKAIIKIWFICLIFGIKFNLKTYKKLVKKQIDKGFEKYGYTLIECPQDKYNWREMFLEEIIDAYGYAEKKNLIK